VITLAAAMAEPVKPQSGDFLNRARAQTSRLLLRVNTAAAVIVLVVIALAAVAVLAALRATRHAKEASAATAQARVELWKSYLAQARAGRGSGALGAKAEGLQTIAAAAAIQPSVALRNEMVAHLAIIDLIPGRPVVEFENNTRPVVDNAGRRVVVRDADKRLLIRTVGATNVLVDVRPSPSITPAVFSPDDKLLLGIDSAGRLAMLDASDGRVLWRHSDFRAFDFTPNSQQLAVISRAGGTMRFLDARTGKPSGGPINVDNMTSDLAIGPDSELTAFETARGVELIARDGRKLATLEHSAPASVLLWKGPLLAVGYGNGDIRIYNRGQARSYWLRGHKSFVSNLSFSQRGDLLVSVSFDGSSKVWNAFTGRELITTTLGFGLRFTAGDQELVYRTGTGVGTWRLSAAEGYRELYVADSASTLHHLDFTRRGDHLGIVKDDGLRIIHLPSEQVVATQRMQRGRSVYFLGDDERILTCGDFRLSLWPANFSESASGELELGAPTHIDLPSREHVDTAAMNAARTHVVLPVSHTSATIIDLARPEQMIPITNTSAPKLSSISPDGRWVVTGTFHGRNGTRLWDAKTGAHVRDLAPGNSSAFFSPNGKLLLVSGPREHLFYETDTWKIVHRISTGAVGDVPNVGAFGPDGSTVALVIERSLIQLFETKTFGLLAALTPPDNYVLNWLAFDHAGERLAAAASSDVVQLWDLRALRQHLAPLGLDWATPSLAAAPRAVAPTENFTRLLVGIVVAVLLVIACAVFVLSKQRRLLAQYFHADALVEQRNRELGLAQAEIMHSQKMKALGTLAAGIAHDFNNLLSVIRMSNKLIAREVPANSEVAENTREIEHAVQQGKSVVRSMLGYSREATENTPVSIAQLVEDTVGLLSRQFLSGITLKLELDRDLPPVPGARGRIEQIMLNLIVNAAEAMDGKGELHIVVRRGLPPSGFVLRPRAADDYISIVVSDSGPGISADVLPRIFEPFFTTKTVGATRGTGLGLSMVHTMCEQDGFGIAVNTKLREGTAFFIVVPLAPIPQPQLTT
jgi:signal transduction histidine kinase